MVILLGGGDGSASEKMENSIQHDVPFLHRDISPYHRSLQRVFKKNDTDNTIKNGKRTRVRS